MQKQNNNNKKTLLCVQNLKMQNLKSRYNLYKNKEVCKYVGHGGVDLMFLLPS